MKAKRAIREPTIGRGWGALPVQSPDVAGDRTFADVGDCDAFLLKPHPEVLGSPQMQANGSHRIVSSSRALAIAGRCGPKMPSRIRNNVCCCMKNFSIMSSLLCPAGDIRPSCQLLAFAPQPLRSSRQLPFSQDLA
jgi:hypothetical protein